MHGPWRYIAWKQFQLKVGECTGGMRGSKGASVHGAIVLVCREPRPGDSPKEIVIIVYKQVVSSCALSRALLSHCRVFYCIACLPFVRLWCGRGPQSGQQDVCIGTVILLDHEWHWRCKNALFLRQRDIVSGHRVLFPSHSPLLPSCVSKYTRPIVCAPF